MSSFTSLNTSAKQPWVSAPQFSTSKHIQDIFYRQNITSEDKNFTGRNALPSLPQKDDLSTSKEIQDLYHEAYLLLKDVIKARKLNNSSLNIDSDVKSNSKEVIHNKTSRQAKLLGQSPLPPFKTRQKTNSASFSVANSSEAAAKYISNRTNSNSYLKISTVDQANFVQALLGQKWINNKTEAHKMLSGNRTKQYMRNNTERRDGKTKPFQNKMKDNDWTKNTSSGFLNNLKTKLKTNSHYKLNSSNISSIAFRELGFVLKTYNARNESSERHEMKKHTHNQNNLNNRASVNRNLSMPSADSWTNVNTSDKFHTSNSSGK